jgi:RAB protein geranylgeranyltransferase component A
VLHVDPQDHYGAQDAAYNLQELIDWAACANGPLYSDIQCSHAFADLPLELQQQSRRFAISLAPVLVPAVSTFVDTLISSGVSHYAGFRLLESLALADRTGLRRIPTSKEDVFKSSDMSLIDKRRLMKFLQFAMGDWEAALLSRYPAIGDLLSSHFLLAGPLLNATMYGFMGCQSKEGAPETLSCTLMTFIPEDTVSALQRLGRLLASSGRYGTSPFLVAQYGGLDEILQGFCRYVGSLHSGNDLTARQRISCARRAVCFGQIHRHHHKGRCPPLVAIFARLGRCTAFLSGYGRSAAAFAARRGCTDRSRHPGLQGAYPAGVHGEHGCSAFRP